MNSAMMTRLCGLGALVLLHGCATNVSMIDADRRALKNAEAPILTLLFTSLGSNGLMVVTYGAAMTGPGSAYLAARNGKEWAQEGNIAHPMGAVRDRVIANLRPDFGADRFKAVDMDLDISEEAPAKLKARLGNGMVMDFTGTYQVIYHLSDFSRFHLDFRGRARLVRLDDGKILWVGNCHTDVEDPEASRPTIEELRANGAARLKGWLARGATECSKQLTDQLLGRSA
jgi:hypothetical protein